MNNITEKRRNYTKSCANCGDITDIREELHNQAQEIIDSIPDGQLNVAVSDVSQPFNTVHMRDIKQHLKEKYGIE